MTKALNLTLKIWRQKGPNQKGRLETYSANDISVDMSFLEMLDMLNESLEVQGQVDPAVGSLKNLALDQPAAERHRA